MGMLEVLRATLWGPVRLLHGLGNLVLFPFLLRLPDLPTFTAQSRLINASDIAAQIRARSPGSRLQFIRGTAPSNTIRTKDTSSHDHVHRVYLGPAKRILNIDTAERTVTCEPGVTMSELVEAVLPLGLVPPVVPEFKALTVGGLIAGAGLESSSFVQGQFCAALDSAKVVLADGSVLDCSREENEELFWGMLGAYGTFGLLVSATLRLEEAKSGWVRVRYQPTQDIVDDIRAVCKEGSDDYVDGIAFGPTCGVIIRGSRSAAPPPPDARILHLSRASSPWFSKHIESALRIKNATWSTPTLLQPIEEWLPLQDYLFRYDRGAYWMGKYALEILPFGYNLISRTLLAPLLTTEALYRRLHAAPEHIVESTLVIQDIYIPEEGAAEFMEFVGSGEAAEDTQIYPLWLCPIKSASNASKLSPNYVEEGNKLFINFGIWHHADHWTPGSPVPKATTRRLERRAHEVGGRKMLYAQTYYTDKEWRSIYDMEWYAFAKSMWDPEGVFGDLRKKIGRG